MPKTSPNRQLPNAELQAGSERYCHRFGRPFDSRLDYQRIVSCRHTSRRIAAAYEAAPVLDRTAVPAYRRFREETWWQLDFLTRPRARGGLGFTVVISPLDPYRNVRELLAELADRRLRIWASAGCGNPHPWLSEHDNDAFRAVHDGFGHGATGRGFDPDGEEAAWWKHAALYSPLARRALLTETRGQTCALFEGPQVGFAPQKAVLLDPRFADRRTLHLDAGCDGRCVKWAA
ncbi:hypothetical protein GCM10023321_37720 [Pseudonocardia eucalypti]|uniref:Uncharacterized protein n=1 Tax=Pseudonocardia eucalypti TaxID=648755 RepID=A0ABP9Q836_9PSEU|nr:hypothetical protein [Pseudonocardia eucalypti]